MYNQFNIIPFLYKILVKDKKILVIICIKQKLLYFQIDKLIFIYLCLSSIIQSNYSEILQIIFIQIVKA